MLISHYSAEAPPKPKRVLNPPKRITSAWLLYYQDELAVSRVTACDIRRLILAVRPTENAKGRAEGRDLSIQEHR